MQDGADNLNDCVLRKRWISQICKSLLRFAHEGIHKFYI